jgi:Domain of unknown function (DUF4190)
VSDTSQGPGWWLASDGRWYPPEQAPGPLPATPEAQTPIAPGRSVPASIPASGPSVPPAVPGDGFLAEPHPGAPPSDASGAGAAWSPPTSDGYGSPPVGNGLGPPPAAPGYGPPPAPPAYGYAPPATGYGYQPGYPNYGFVPAPRTNGFAIASLVCSLLWIFGLSGVLAIVFGFIARSQIKRSGDGQRGNGLALAGIIIGFVGLAATVLFFVAVAAVDHHCHQDGTCTFTTLNNGN